MIGDDKDFSGKVCVKWKDTEFERQVRSSSESLITRGEAIHAQATVSNRNAAEGELLEQHRALLQSKLLEPAVVVPSLFTHVGAFFLYFCSLSFSFCSTCKLFICFYSTTPTPSSRGFMRMKWPNFLLVVSFSFLFFFFFFFA